jgi:tetratricopeptide (TPR) repeat protein
MLAAEWAASRLQDALRTMTPRAARTLLRRLDHGLQNPRTSVAHWPAYAEDFKSDVLGKLHVMACQVRSGEANVPPLKELLTVARQLRDAELPMRAGVFLRIAATRDVEGVTQRLDIGQGLLAVGYVPEAAPWIEEVCEELIERGQPDIAIAPLRELVNADRANRNARRLLNRARTRAVRKRITRKHAVIAMAIAFVIVSSAVVQVRMKADYERKIDEVRALMQSPIEGLARLEDIFSEDESERIIGLRLELERRARQADEEKRSAWVELFTQAQLECNVGDPVLGLQSALSLPPKPMLREQRQPWPAIDAVFDGLGARLEGEIAALGEAVLDTPEQIAAEERLAELVRRLSDTSADSTLSGVVGFRERLSGLSDLIDERVDERAAQRAARAREESLSLQDRLLATARSHREAGDFTRAIESYERLVQVDQKGQIAELLEREIAETRQQEGALARARDLAQRGGHEEARTVLVDGLGTDTSHTLPWKVETFPSGARARFGDGSTRTTPFQLETRFGETVSFTLESPGYDTRRVRVGRPADLSLYLSRSTELHWRTQGRVDALPVAMLEDHIVADRGGRVARVRPDGSEVWVREIPTLSGIARAPVFLPRKPDHLLLVTEDGEAWIVKAKDGAVDGPLAVGSPPFQGPLPTEEGVVVVFTDGRELAWNTLLQPREASVLPRTADDGGVVEGRYGSDVGLGVLRRRTGQDEVTSPWTRWTVTVRDTVFEVREDGADGPLFTVLREGVWTWMAWEAPSSSLPRGRLWVSDGAGLRSFQAP